MNVNTISFMKKNVANLPLDEPMMITKNGIPAYVIESVFDRERRNESIALMKLVSFARKDRQDGRVLSSIEFKERLTKKKALMSNS